PVRHLANFTGILQADAYSGFNGLYEAARKPAPITAALCRVGGDVSIPAPHRPGRAGYPHPVLHTQGSLRRRCTDGRSRLAARDAVRVWL
ncbi:MAG: hypothetical protein EPO10_19790, partial [Reyranella sp.]